MSKGALFSKLKDMCPTISVGMLTADLMNLGGDLSILESAGIGLVHFDVMDGCFCPSMTIGPPLIKAVKTPLIKDVHLMIVDPLTKLGDYAAAGADMITVHLESCPTHIHRVLQQLGTMANANDPETGIIRGVAINPGTPVEAIEPLLGEIDAITLLAINPGWGGQAFIKSTRERIARVKDMVAKSGQDIFLCVDGGITRNNIADVAGMGVDMVVTGSAVFDGKAPLENAKYMLDAFRAGRI